MATWEWALGLFLIMNLKALPFIWHYRFFTALGSGILLNWRTRRFLKPHHIFLPTVSTVQAPWMEVDFNLHKSNSTYFTDLDVARAYLSGVLFWPLFATTSSAKRCNMIVGAVSCTFKREIKPYRSYEMWTRVVSWDEKWIYMVTHFVEKGAVEPGQHVLQPGLPSAARGGGPGVVSACGRGRAVFASAITRFVCKRGRITVPPSRALEECGLLPELTGRSDAGRSSIEAQREREPSESLPQTFQGLDGSQSMTMEDIEACRKSNLPIVRLQRGWDEVHGLFKEDDPVLARSWDMTWN
ncbi:hypothetical protein BR93DRAFT_919051 [Coniochaeta sp. PMI_546]|nr:hypothetical protein BR93DRAFT_919051 [Coniochaeta sp. PMI_546]